LNHQQRPISTLISSWQQLRKRQSPATTQAHRNNSSTRNPNTDKTRPPEAPTKATTKLRQQLQSITPHENIYTLPNILTFSRLLAAPAIGYFIINSNPIAALSLFFYAGVTDLIDGWVARRYNSQTVVGTVIDPMADKTLMTICVLALGYTGQFPWWLVVIIFGRDVALAISAIYFRWISLPPPKTMRRYWDFSLPSAEVRPTEISKINTLLQLLLVGDAMVLPVLPSMLVENWNLVGVLEGWELLVAGTTMWSGLSYIGNKDAVKILTNEERDEKMEEMKGKRGKGDGKD
jgi:cardiolipin synthase (CMP-forming)